MALNNIPPLAFGSFASGKNRELLADPVRRLVFIPGEENRRFKSRPAIIALRENEPIATSVGIDVTRTLVARDRGFCAMAGAAARSMPTTPQSSTRTCSFHLPP